MDLANTCRFHLREEGADFLPLHNVRDDVARDFRMRAVGDDDRRATLQSPEGCFHLIQRTPRLSTMQLLTRSCLHSQMTHWRLRWPLLPCRQCRLWTCCRTWLTAGLQDRRCRWAWHHLFLGDGRISLQKGLEIFYTTQNQSSNTDIDWSRGQTIKKKFLRTHNSLTEDVDS